MSGGDRSPLARAVRGTLRNWAPYLGLTTGLFLVTMIVGAAVGAKRQSHIVPVRGPGDPVLSMDPAGLFFHNTQVVAFLAGGVLLFGIPTLYVLALNGFLFGSTMADAIDSLGVVEALAVVAPHGVLELPAFWLAAAIATRWLHVIAQTARGGKRRVPVYRTVVETLFAIVAVVVLLGVAALIEGTITESIARSI